MSPSRYPFSTFGTVAVAEPNHSVLSPASLQRFPEYKRICGGFRPFVLSRNNSQNLVQKKQASQRMSPQSIALTNTITQVGMCHKHVKALTTCPRKNGRLVTEIHTSNTTSSHFFSLNLFWKVLSSRVSEKVGVRHSGLNENAQAMVCRFA